MNNRAWNPFRKKCVSQMPYKIGSHLTDFMEPGDIVLYRALGYQVLGGLIADITHSPYSHCEVYVKDGWTIEAGVSGVSYSDGMHTYKGGIDIFRWKEGLTEAQKKGIVEAAQKEIGDPYQYTLLFFFPFLSRKALARRAAIHSFICSELAAYAYAKNGLNSCGNPEPDSADAPADLGRSSNLKWLGCYADSKKVEGAKRNIWDNGIQGKPNLFDRIFVTLLVDPLSKRTAYYEKLAETRKSLANHRATRQSIGTIR